MSRRQHSHSIRASACPALSTRGQFSMLAIFGREAASVAQAVQLARVVKAPPVDHSTGQWPALALATSDSPVQGRTDLPAAPSLVGVSEQAPPVSLRPLA